MGLRDWPLPILIALALTAFSANSLLARAALEGGMTDPVSFTAIRLGAGAVVLWAILALSGSGPRIGDVDRRAALGLFAYALFFSLGYLTIEAGIGALILFGAVQATMIGAGLWMGERTTRLGAAGIVAALIGVAALLAPGRFAPDPLGFLLMGIAGVSWGVYSLAGRGAADPLRATAANFIAAAPLALLAALVALGFIGGLKADGAGVSLALASGALASGCGYVVWYAALRRLAATRAAILQLGTPALTALAGAALLAEPITGRLVLSAIAILGGVGLYLSQKQSAAPAARGEGR